MLETVGASWHRGRKRHLFTATWDPDMFADVIETGEAPPANPLAYFATPPAVSAELLETRQLRDALHKYGEIRVLEPSAGTGALALATAQEWAAWARAEDEIAGEAGWALDMQPRLHLTLIELDDRRVKILWSKLAPKISALLPGRITVQIIAGDFLQLEAPEREALGEVDVVVMNPPFSLPGDRSAWWTHMRHALSLVGENRGVVACIAPPAWKHSHRGDMLEAIGVICRGVAFDFPPGAFSASGTGIATCGVVIRKCDTIDREPLDTHFAEIVIDSTLALNDQLRAAAAGAAQWGSPKHEDSKSAWRRTLFDLSLAVARGGDLVSFSEEYQQRLSRVLWAIVSER